ncbi:MAG: hypothetical protein JXA99_05700 [Candidatus Lokiarchaeota archaeon]|nr:hypothetical protein [Candidatus Lokiarchaeota archaeon]
MSKSEVSYYDWKKTFKKKVSDSIDYHNKNESQNSLDISDNEFKEYLKNWKKKNL